MKKTLLFISILFISCNFPSYQFVKKQNTGVDFSKGKWLLNEVEAPLKIKEKLEEKSYKDLKSFLGDRLTQFGNAKGILINARTPTNPTKNQLQELRNGTNFDYFINIKAGILKDDLGSLSISTQNLNNFDENKSQVILEIYDLENLQIIYSNKIIAITQTPQNSSSDVHFSTSSENLIINGYKKLIKDLSKKSIK